MLLLVFAQKICTSENLIVFEYCPNIIQYVPECFRQHSEIIIKLAWLFQQRRRKRVELPIFFSSKISFTHTSFCSSKIGIFNRGLVSNKNILSISIFNNIMHFKIYRRSVHLYNAVAECNVTTAHCCVLSSVYVSVKVRPYTEPF